eukprot:11540047-Alexandrium_andersonii.AAC.1
MMCLTVLVLHDAQSHHLVGPNPSGYMQPFPCAARASCACVPVGRRLESRGSERAGGPETCSVQRLVSAAPSKSAIVAARAC